MTPWQKALAWQEENSTKAMADLFGHYLSHGLVHSDSTLFLAAMEVSWDPVTKAINWHAKEEPNAWFIELAAGSTTYLVRDMIKVAPRPLPFVLWCRGAFRVHAWTWDHLLRHS